MAWKSRSHPKTNRMLVAFPIMFVAAAPTAVNAATPIVVTGKALPTLEKAGPAVILIDRTTLDQNASGRLETVLVEVPGIQTFRRADSSTAHPTTAGITARGLGGNAAGRMLVIADGVPQNDPFGGWVDFPMFARSRIDRLVIERGGGQARWGSGAIAGIVEIESGSDGALPAFEASARAGSRKSLDLDATAVIGDRMARLLLGAALRRSDGFIPIAQSDRGPADIRAPFSQASGIARGAIALANSLEFQGGVQLVDDRRERGLADSANRTRGADLSVRLVGRGDHPFQLAAYRQLRRFQSQFAAASPDRSTSRLTLDQYRVPASGWGARGEIDLMTGASRLRIGGDVRTGSGTTNERYQFVAGVPTRQRRAGGDFTTGGTFAQAAIDRDVWTLAGSLRIDRWMLGGGRIDEWIVGGAVLTDVRFKKRTGWQPSGRVSIARKIGSGEIEAAAYRGWRLPTLNELYRPFRVGPDATAANALLKPEKLVGGQLAATTGELGPFSFSATIFADRLRDAIGNVSLGMGPGTFPGVGFVAAGGRYSQRQNFDAIQSVGTELSAHWRRGPWQVDAAAAVQRSRVKASGLAAPLNGLRPAQVPAVSATLGAAWRPADDRWLSIATRFEGARYDDDLSQQRLKPSVTVDASAEWPIAAGFSLTAAAENLFDARVETGFSGAAVERSMPRTIWLGVRLHRQASRR